MRPQLYQIQWPLYGSPEHSFERLNIRQRVSSFDPLYCTAILYNVRTGLNPFDLDLDLAVGQQLRQTVQLSIQYQMVVAISASKTL